MSAHTGGEKVPASIAAAVLAVDTARWEALARGEIDRLGSLAAADVVHVPGRGLGVQKGRESYLEYCKSAIVAGVPERIDPVVRTWDDIAILAAIIDRTDEEKGNVYSAVYSGAQSGDLKLISFHLTSIGYRPNGVIPIPPSKPITEFFVQLTPDQQQVLELDRQRFEMCAQKNGDRMDPHLADEIIYIHGAGTLQWNKEEYLQVARRSSPELIAIDEPQVRMYGDVAIINAIRRDASGTGSFGIQPTIVWRNNVNYLSAYRRTGGKWKMIHYHATPIPALGDFGEVPHVSPGRPS